MPEEYDDEERAVLEKFRAERKRKQADDKEVWIKSDTGDEASMPYSKALPWLRQKFGIDLEEEIVQDAPDAAPGKEPAAGDEGVRRFGGRRVG